MKIHNNISYKVWVGAEKLCIRFNKVDGSRVYKDLWYYLVSIKKMIPLKIGLDIL